MTLTPITINKAFVLAQVAMTSGYVGAKGEGADADALDRVGTTEADAEQLERYWLEAIVTLEAELKKNISGIQATNTDVEITFDVSAAFDPVMRISIETGIKSYLINSIQAKWYAITSRKDAADCSAMAAAKLTEVKQGLYHKAKPKRPTYDD